MAQLDDPAVNKQELQQQMDKIAKNARQIVHENEAFRLACTLTEQITLNNYIRGLFYAQRLGCVGEKGLGSSTKWKRLCNPLPTL